MTSIGLIGLPGSGKTTLGKLITKELGWDFIDTDDIITTKSGYSVPKLFSKFGEEHFRKLETDAIQSLINRTNVIVAFGGGAPIHNQELVKNNFTTILIDRPIKYIAKVIDNSRPLLKSRTDLDKLAKERMPVYRSIADFTVELNASVKDGVVTILNLIKNLQ
jgi:shikimate kinase